MESDAENAQTNSEEEEEEISEVDEEIVPKSDGKGKGKAVVKVKPTLKKPKKKAEPKGTASTKEAEISEDNNLYSLYCSFGRVTAAYAFVSRRCQ